MKTELIEYHRQEADWNKAYGTEVANELVRFHERAVAWLEGLLLDEEAMDIAAHIKPRDKTKTPPDSELFVKQFGKP